MEMFNNWLNEIQHNNTGVELYDLTGTICTVIMYAAILWYIWRQRMNPFKGLIIGYLARLFMDYAQHLVTWFQRDFEIERYLGTANFGYALILLPLLCWLCDWTFNIPRGTSGELAAVSTMAWHWIGRSGCTFTGCCYGIPCDWGVYSKHAEGNTFPVCWVESLLILAIFIFLLVRMLRRSYLPEQEFTRSRVMNRYCRKRRMPDNGRALPYTLIFYGTGRFFTEFLRYHEPDRVLFGFLPELSILALVMVLVGGFMLRQNIREEKAAAAPAAQEKPA